MTVRRGLPTGASLQDFIRRAQVLGLYRTFIRLGRRVERPDLREDVLNQMKFQFRNNRHMPKETVSTLLVDGQRQLELLRSMAGPPLWTRDKGTTGQHAAQAPILSWQEAGKPEEERGKVGEGWPWDEESEDKTRHD